MRTRLYIQKKTSSKSTSIPATNQFQSRPFAPPTTESSQQQPDLQAQQEKPKTFGHSLANICITNRTTAGRLPIQTKLTIGQPGDKYEQEADKVAAQVVNQINSPVTQKSQSENIQREELPEEDELMMKPEVGSIQREEIAEDDEELQMKAESDIIQREEIAEDDEELQMKSEVDQGGTATPDLEASIQQARSSGKLLTNEIRTKMESAFGADFSGVKIHNDAQSDQLNRSIQARAFTTGQDIFFRQGAYNPGSRGGQELLAHELTHVVQQSGGNQIQRQKHSQLIQLRQVTNGTIQRDLAFDQSWTSVLGGIGASYWNFDAEKEKLNSLFKSLKNIVEQITLPTTSDLSKPFISVLENLNKFIQELEKKPIAYNDRNKIAEEIKTKTTEAKTLDEETNKAKTQEQELEKQKKLAQEKEERRIAHEKRQAEQKAKKLEKEAESKREAEELKKLQEAAELARQNEIEEKEQIQAEEKRKAEEKKKAEEKEIKAIIACFQINWSSNIKTNLQKAKRLLEEVPNATDLKKLLAQVNEDDLEEILTVTNDVAELDKLLEIVPIFQSDKTLRKSNCQKARKLLQKLPNKDDIKKLLVQINEDDLEKILTLSTDVTELEELLKLIDVATLKKLLPLSNNAAELRELLNLTDAATLENLLTQYPKASHNLKNVVRAHLASGDWEKSTYSSEIKSILDHYQRHVLNEGLAKTVEDYCNDAKACWDNALDTEKIPGDKNGVPRVKVRKHGSQRGGNYSPAGKIYTFWYQ